jgi:phospho-N-acetylmuramoyl-pentapeptide-transferase
MFYHIATEFQTHCSILNIFRYVSVRSIGALLSALLFSFIFGNWFISFCQRKFRSKVRDWTPESHLVKNNTPTMGGLFILSIFLINTFLWNNLTKAHVWIFVLCIAGFGLIGFLDDWEKITYQKGISVSLKFNLQVLWAIFICLAWYFIVHPDTQIYFPFFKKFTPDILFFLIPWAVFVIIATSNAVNLTDGLDGLATGPLITNFATFGIIAYLSGHRKFSEYLYISFTGSAELSIIAATLVGALLGFLWYNTYPAQIFMGDVGSLALGSGLAIITLMTKQELLLIISGGIFIAETVSVILQVISFKLRGKRIFKMAPLHHHFELLGWKEAKITVRFWIISLMLSLTALLTLKIR